MISNKPRTLNDIFFGVVERNSDRVMLTRQNGTWMPISAQQLYKRVVGTANALKSWGVERGDRVIILSENRPEWAIADFATLLLGAVDVPIYSTLTADQISYMLRHSGAKVAFVSTSAQLTKIQQARAGTAIERIVVMDDMPITDGVTAMSPIMAAGPDTRDAAFDATARAITRDELATLIYTSGTTGTPKGVMLTHGNLTSNLECSLDAFEFNGSHHLAISFLPLSHITARHVDYAMMVNGVTLAYCPVIEDLVKFMPEVRPTVFVAVPRVYEKIYNGVEKKIGPHGAKRKLYEWALGVGAKHVDEIVAGKTPTAIDWLLARKLIYSKVTSAMGGRVEVFISGGAPLGKEIGEWYAKIGIRILEGYGLTETSPVIALNNPRHCKLGTVGPPLKNVEVRTADDGEILVRGPSIFKGYWNMPQETAEAFDGDWFKTGDIGQVDEQGFLSITDRKKDLIKTSGGKFIAPQPIENSLKANALISEAAVIGDRRRFPAVVVAPSFQLLEEWAQNNSLPFRDRKTLVQNPRVQALYHSIVEEVNHNLAKYEKLKKVLVIPEELTIADGTLTPTMKLRRRVLEQKYRSEIERMYADAGINTTEQIAANG